jgi:hypothetical protein
MSAVTIIPPAADLAARIRAEHEAAQSALRSAVSHAVEAGKLLIEAKKTVGHGNWAAWIKDNCEFSERAARGYMRLARELPKLEDGKRQRVADLSLRDALASLSTDARNLSSIPAPERERVLAEADSQGLSQPLKQRVNHLLYVRSAEKQEQDIWTVFTPPVVLPPASMPLVADLIAVCRKFATDNPALGVQDILEALNESYCHIQQCGLGSLPPSYEHRVGAEAGEKVIIGDSCLKTVTLIGQTKDGRLVVEEIVVWKLAIISAETGPEVHLYSSDKSSPRYGTYRVSERIFASGRPLMILAGHELGIAPVDDGGRNVVVGVDFDEVVKKALACRTEVLINTISGSVL